MEGEKLCERMWGGGGGRSFVSCLLNVPASCTVYFMDGFT